MSASDGTLTGRARPTKYIVGAPPLLLLAALGAWSVLWFWSVSPYAGYLDHGSWLEIGALASVKGWLPAKAWLQFPGYATIGK